MNYIYPAKDTIFTAGELIKILSSVNPDTEVVVIADCEDESVDYIGAIKVGTHLVGLCLQSGMEIPD